MATDDLNLRITSSEKLETIISTIENFHNLKNANNKIFIELDNECKKLDNSYKSISEKYDFWTKSFNEFNTSDDTTSEYNFTNKTAANLILTTIREGFLSFCVNFNTYEKRIEELCNGKETLGILNETVKNEIIRSLETKKNNIQKWTVKMEEVHRFLNPDLNKPKVLVIPCNQQ